MWDLTLAVLLGTLLLIVWYFYMKLHRPTGFPPGPPALPILGSIPFFHMPKEARGTAFYTELSRFGKQYGGIYSVAFGHTWMVILNDITSIREALVNHSTCFAGRPIFETVKFYNPYLPALGIIDGNYDEQWKLQRQTILHILRKLGFSRDASHTMICEELDLILEAFRTEESQGTVVDVQDHIHNAVCNVSMRFLLGSSYRYADSEFREFRLLIGKVLESLEKFVYKIFIPGLFILPAYKRDAAILYRDYEELRAFLETKLKSIPKDLVTDDPQNFVEGYRMERRRNADIENRTYQILTDLIQTGMETTANSLGWWVYYMVANPDIQQALHDEIDRVVGRGHSPTYTHKEKMPYTEAAILETLRIACTVPRTLSHMTLEDVTIGGYHIPKGTNVTANLWNALRDPDAWPEPDVFRPERFLSDDGKIVIPDDFIPFGLGRRVCIGEQLAKQEMFLFVTHILQAFTLQLPDGQPAPPPLGTVAMTYHPPKVKVCVIPRE